MILLLSACALLTLSSTQRSHPPLHGAIQGRQVGAPLRILRDELGIAHVQAASEDDAWYGLGFLHAQDRLFQADLSRHLAEGRIAEWLGEDAVALDGFLGAMKLLERGADNLANSDDATRAMVNAYTRGMNDGVGSLKTLPVEYRLLGVEFEPWRPEDCTAVGFLQAWALADNPERELLAVLLGEIEPELLDALTRTDPRSPPIDPFWDELRGRGFGQFTPGFAAFTNTLGGRPSAEASNNWVVGGDRTASGKPIVANDPHLVQSVPSLWYPAHIQGGKLDVAGATLAGSPGFPIGHNDRVAWGLTNVMADLVDFVALEGSSQGYVLGTRQLALEARQVTVRPKDGEPVVRETLWTEVGPVVNAGGNTLLAMRWHALELDDRLHTVLHRLATAESVDGARASVEGLPLMVSQNVVMGDVDGGWGWQVVGSIPVREGFTGRVPYPGGDPNLGWRGWHTGLPAESEPARGWVHTANARPDHPLADALSTSYIPPHRHDRIAALLDGLPDATPADMSRVQNDLRDSGADRMLDALLEGVQASGSGVTCHEALTSWDRQSTPDSRGAAVWAMFQPTLLRVALRDRLTEAQIALVLDATGTARSPFDGSVGDRPRWDVLLPDRVGAVQTALSETCDVMTSRFGDPEGWTWGAIRPLALTHPFGRRSKLLAGWNMDEVPFGGTGTTVAAAEYDWADEDWRVRGMASLRIVMPLDDLGASTFVHPGGVGGQPRSPSYRAHYDAFVAGDTLPLWFDEEDLQQHVVHTLVVSP